MNRTHISATLLALSVLLQAQPPAVPPKPAAPISVTGCLQRTETEKYTLTSSEGKRYELRTQNADIKLGIHVGQQVTVTGASDASAPPPAATKVDPQGFLDVVSLIIVSPTCQGQ